MTDVLDEWLTTTSALAWILTRDASFAASMRGPISANRFSVEVAMWMATRMADSLPSVRGPAAREALMDACRRGKLTVMGFGGRLDGAFNGEAEVIPSNAFAYLRLDEAAKPTLEPVDLHAGRAWRSLAFDRSSLLSCFPAANGTNLLPEEMKVEVQEPGVGKVSAQPGDTGKDNLGFRKRGALSLASKDKPFIEMMRQLVEVEEHTRNRASEIIWAEHGGKIAGTGNEDSRKKRLRDGYNSDRRGRGLGDIGE